MWKTGSWEKQVLRETRRHLACFMPVYLADASTLRGNKGAYFNGQIWLAEELAGRQDVEVEEVLHHEIFHAKFALAKAHNVRFSAMSIDDAKAQAMHVSLTELHGTPRAALIEYYRLNADQDFAEECLVQLCLMVRFKEPVELPPKLHAACRALVRPFCHRPVFWGGFVGSLPYAFQTLRSWERSCPLPGKWPLRFNT